MLVIRYGPGIVLPDADLELALLLYLDAHGSQLAGKSKLFPEALLWKQIHDFARRNIPRTLIKQDNL